MVEVAVVATEATEKMKGEEAAMEMEAVKQTVVAEETEAAVEEASPA